MEGHRVDLKRLLHLIQLICCMKTSKLWMQHIACHTLHISVMCEKYMLMVRAFCQLGVRKMKKGDDNLQVFCTHHREGKTEHKSP